jgi:iron complex outermembrane receptor protein
VSRDFTVMVGLGALDSKYKDLILADSVNGGFADLSGNHLLEAPPYTANLALDYAIPLERFKVGLHADANWTGKQYFTAFNNTPPYNGDVSAAHWESNARISFGSADGKYDFGFWGKNLNNNEARTFSTNPAAFGIRFSTVPYPRRYGADFRWNF